MKLMSNNQPQNKMKLEKVFLKIDTILANENDQTHEINDKNEKNLCQAGFVYASKGIVNLILNTVYRDIYKVY